MLMGNLRLKNINVIAVIMQNLYIFLDGNMCFRVLIYEKLDRVYIIYTLAATVKGEKDEVLRGVDI